MKKIVLTSCGKKKQMHKSKACDLYIGSLFLLALQFAKKLKPDAIFILSAKHGLLDLDTEIEPYNVTLNKMAAADQKVWARTVVDKLKEKGDLEKDHFIFLAGQKYRENLIPYISHYEIPLQGLGIGEQLQYLKRRIHE